MDVKNIKFGLDKKLFQDKMIILMDYYDYKPSKDTLKIYWKEFCNMEDSNFERMIDNIIRNFVPTSVVRFPLIPHFIENKHKVRYV